MERLRCGVVLTDAFLNFLKEEAERTVPNFDDPVAVIEYVKCAEGARAGEAWWRLTWGNGRGKDDWCLFHAADVRMFLCPQTQKALKWKHIDYIDGEVFVPA